MIPSNLPPFRPPKSDLRSKFRDQTRRLCFAGRGFPRTPRHGNIKDKQNQPKA